MTDETQGADSDGLDTDGPIDLGALARAVRDEMGAGALPATEGEAARVAEHAGDVIDRYELVDRIGEGGMGVVWAADQREPVRRRVALKVIKLGMDTERVVARFEAERQALARMEHPHIAAVLDGGATRFGRPYFVMELVDGVPVTRYCDRQRLGLRGRLELFLQVCSALQHAHQKGVVHRDIKPSNVLVAEVDGAPHAKVIDFGIARVTDDERPLETRLTEQVEVIGTLEYMAPEQASGGSQDVDTRADVYSLGVLLYELLTGERPFELPDAQRQRMDLLLRAIREQDPVRPSSRVAQSPSATGGRATVVQRPGIDARRLRSALASELDWIALKALEKDRERRYPSAAGLASDVERYLAGDTILARPPSRSYRVKKFVGRNRGAVAAAAGMLLLLIAGVAGTGYGLVRSLRANEDLAAAVVEKEQQREIAAREAERATEARRVLADMLTGVAPTLARGKDTELLVAILDDTSRRIRDGDVADALVAADLDMDIGGGYFALGRFGEALVHMERASGARAEALGAEAPATLHSRRRRADVLRMMERVPEAEAAYRDVLSALRRTLGEEDPETLAAMRGLGSHLHRMGRIDESYELLSTAVEIERRTFSAAQRADSSSLAELGTLEFYSRRRTERAKELFDEALDLVRTHRGADHPWALRYTETLAQIAAQTGDFDRAVEMSEDLAREIERIYGPEHRTTLATEANRAFTLGFVGRADDGEALMRAVLVAQRRVLGDDDPDTLWTRAQVALIDARARRYDDAATALEDVIERMEARGVPTLEAWADLAGVYRDMGEPEAAREVLEDLLPRAEHAMGAEHPFVQEVRRRLERLTALIDD
ncbi:MAG: tetratricopeptide repeat protein [Planctomycetota bacterium]